MNNLLKVRRLYLVIFFLILGLVHPSFVRASPPEGYNQTPVFSDEFDGPNLDTTKWATKMPYSLRWWRLDGLSDRTTDSEEIQWYVDDAQKISTDSGVLSLNVKHECIPAGRPEIDPTIYNSTNICNGNYTSNCNDNGPYSCAYFPYTSGMIASYPGFAQKYGYFEARIKIPAGGGLWPAFWLMPMADPVPDHTPWPWTSVFWPPEIDIMENNGDPNYISSYSHFSGDWPNPGSSLYPNYWYHGGFTGNEFIGYNPSLGPNFSADFHTFGLEWESNRLTWYVDNEPRFTTTQNIPPGNQLPGFTGRMYIIASLAVSEGNPPDSSMDIDYIRVYQKSGASPAPTPTPLPTSTPLPTPTITPLPTSTPLPTPTPGQEIVNPTNISTLAVGTDVLLNFNNFPSPSDGRAIPANYSGMTWNTLVEGSPWAGISTWNFYITNGGPHGTIVFPRPVIVKSLLVSSGASNLYTLSSTGNPDVNITTSGNSPRTLTTNWTTPVLSVTISSSIADQVFDDLRFTVTDSSPTPFPTPGISPSPSPLPSPSPSLTPSPSPIPTAVPTPLPTPTSTPRPTPTPSPTPIPSPTPTPSATPTEVVNPTNISTLAVGTDVLLNFNNFPSPSDGRAIPANYSGMTWNTLVEGSPWAGISTWNFYITNGGSQGTVTYPRPVIVKSIVVSSTSSNLFTLISAGNSNVSITASGSHPQNLVTGWTNPVTSLTIRSSTPDQAFDDLRFTTE